MRPALTEQILGLEPGSHVCLLYPRHSNEQMPAIIPFLLQGLAGGEQCIYVVADQTADEFNAHLREHDLDTEPETARGRLKLLTKEEWRQPGVLESGKKTEQLRQFIAHAQEAGFSGVRFGIEMGWARDPEIAPEAIEHWEATINALVGGAFPVRMICQYNRARFPAPVILAALHTHPFVIVEDELCQNVFYQAPLILESGVKTKERVRGRRGSNG